MAVVWWKNCYFVCPIAGEDVTCDNMGKGVLCIIDVLSTVFSSQFIVKVSLVVECGYYQEQFF